MILYEDKDIIVCHKMAGIAVQSARIGEKDLVSMLNNHLMEQADQRMEPVRVVHRLDQPVEGIVVFAKNKKAAASLSAQITDGSMKKVYQAVCCVTEAGKHWLPEAEGMQKADVPPDWDEGTATDRKILWHSLTDYLVKDAKTNSSAVVTKDRKGAKEARLSFWILSCREVQEQRMAEAAGVLGYVLAEIQLDTGRHHQIRVQMAHAGLPLFGDRKYNPDWELYAKAWQAQMVNESADHAVHRLPAAELALCATELDFRHPKTAKPMHFQVKPQKRIFQMFQGTR